MELNALLAWLLILIGAMHFTLVAYVWRYRDVPGGTPYILAMISGGGWAISFGLPLVQPDLELARLVTQARFAVLSFMGPAIFLMIFEHARQETARDWRLLTVLFAIPAVTFALSLTMPWHRLMRYDFQFTSISGIAGIAYREGPWYHVHMAYTNLLVVVGVGLGLASMRGRGLLFQRQCRVLTMAPLLPFALNIAFLVGVWPAPVLNLAPFSLLVSGLLMAMALFRYRMFDLRPQAVNAAVAQMQDAFLLVDARNRLVDLNEAAALVLGIPVAQALGQDLAHLFESWPEAKTLLNNESDRHFQVEIACCPDLPEVATFFDVRSAPVKANDGMVLGRVLLFRDITDRKRLEERLAQSLVHERELHQLKSMFVSLVSHEFRTPLAALQGAADLLKTHFTAATTEMRQRSLESIHSQIRRLSSLLDQATAMNRLEEGRVPFSPQPVELLPLVQQWCTAAETEAGRHDDVKIEPEQPPAGKIMLDSFLAECIVSNLVANALKYSAPGTPVRVRIRHDRGRLTIVVCDQGIGIPEQLRPFLFQPFHRGANVGRIKGTGVGLFLARRCAELHGGTIKADERDCGTCFTVTLSAPTAEATP